MDEIRVKAIWAVNAMRSLKPFPHAPIAPINDVSVKIKASIKPIKVSTIANISGSG
jgi:hypothetical protein